MEVTNSLRIVNKTISTRCIIVEELGKRLGSWLDDYLVTLFDHVDNTHSEVSRAIIYVLYCTHCYVDSISNCTEYTLCQTSSGMLLVDRVSSYSTLTGSSSGIRYFLQCLNSWTLVAVKLILFKFVKLRIWTKSKH
jgi:hypothetical protein